MTAAARAQRVAASLAGSPAFWIEFIAVLFSWPVARSLRASVEAGGFEIERLEHFHAWLVAPAWVLRRTPLRRLLRGAPEEASFVNPTVNRLQQRAAERIGVEAALFVPSGTMANQLALRVLTRPGDLVLAGENAHVLLVLHALRFDPLNIQGAELLCGMIPKHMPY